MPLDYMIEELFDSTFAILPLAIVKVTEFNRVTLSLAKPLTIHTHTVSPHLVCMGEVIS